MEEENKKYICEKCNFNSKYKSSYDKHLNSVLHNTGIKKTRSDKKINKCETCEEIFASQNALKEHILNKHSDIKLKEENYKYYCKYCNIGSNSECIYRKHLLSKKHQHILKLLNFNTL